MSLDTKQILHIVTELIVIVGISIYFVNKNKILSDHIEELELKIKQQEEILQNHDNLILKIMNTINVMNSPQHQQPQQPQPQPQIPQLLQKNKIKLPKNINSSKKVVMIIPPSPQKPVQKKPKVEEIIEEEDEDENECDNEFREEDLDEELLEELKDLEEGLEEDI